MRNLARRVGPRQGLEMWAKVVAGYKGTNAKWLDGVDPMFERKGPAIAFLTPDEVDDDSKEWQEIVELLKHAKTLA